MLQSLKIGRVGAFIGIFAAGAFIFSLSFPAQAYAAASLYMEPTAGTFTLGSTFSVSIYVNTGGQAINAIEANLHFPPDKLQVVIPSSGKSSIQVWIAQPTYSNMDGTLKFQGTIPTPGINTNAGLISTVTFRVKNIGTAVIKIKDDSRVLLNDGLGTNVLGQKTDGIYNFVLPPPAGPIVTSRTHPDQGKWYSSNQVVFEWVAPEDAQGYSYILSQSPADEPDDISEGLKTRLVYDDLADGTYYFQIKSLRQGAWGGITNYIINIDATPPADFSINFSPRARTSNKRPIIDFKTTDAASGVEHYEIKIVPLDSPLAYTEQNKTPFFFEVVPPYWQEFADGRYDVIARAYDYAGNYVQSEERLTVTRPLFEFLVSDGLRIGGGYVVRWPWLALVGSLLLILFAYFARTAWKWHRQVEEYLKKGAGSHPQVLEKLEALREKQKQYDQPISGPGNSEQAGGTGKSLMVLLLLAGLAYAVFSPAGISWAEEADTGNVRIEPPVVTLFPKSVSNDEIVYIGGRAGAPQAKVLIYLQNLDTGGTVSYVAVTDKNGEWFHSFPKFLNPGNYVAWTQMQVGDEISPPSSRLDLIVQKTAIQIGGARISFESFYFVLLLLFAAAFFTLLTWVIYHTYHYRSKNRRLMDLVRNAEESVRRGFALIKKDIEEELGLIHKAKLSKELSAEERLREEKLLRDLEEVGRHIGREVWEIEHGKE